MPWVKLDDGFFRHPKARIAGRDGRALFVAGLCHCAANLTDGRIDKTSLPLVAVEAEVRPGPSAKKLVEAGLWSDEGDHYLVHDFLEYQPSRQQVEADRAAARDRMRKARTTRTSHRSSGDVRANSGRSSPNPVPSRPLPSSSPPTTNPNRGPEAGADAPAEEEEIQPQPTGHTATNVPHWNGNGTPWPPPHPPTRDDLHQAALHHIAACDLHWHLDTGHTVRTRPGFLTKALQTATEAHAQRLHHELDHTDLDHNPQPYAIAEQLDPRYGPLDDGHHRSDQKHQATQDWLTQYETNAAQAVPMPASVRQAIGGTP